MTTELHCTECGSTDVIPHAPVVVYLYPSTVSTPAFVEIAEKPDALLFKGVHREMLGAKVCGKCGFVKLFVNNAEQLLAAYRQQHGT